MALIKDYWAHKGCVFGRCQSHKNYPWFWVNIPKNASSFSQTLFAHELDWHEHNFYDPSMQGKTALVALRDPIERWISGIAEYVSRYHKQFNEDSINDYFLDWIFDRIAFDDHTEKQVYFVDGLDVDKCVWFWVDQSLEPKLVNWMESAGLVQSPFRVPECVYEYSNKSTDDPEKVKISKFFQQVIARRPGCHARLKAYFKPDYDLISSVKFI